VKRVKRICQVCGKEFETWESEVRKGRGMFCSRECYWKYMMEEVKTRWQDSEYREKISGRIKDLWQDPEYREKTIRSTIAALKLKPNGLERTFCDLLQSYFPGEWRYVGDGKVFIAGFVPDFIHKEENWIIELNGDYWHSSSEARERDRRKKEAYEKTGYKVLEIWESEFSSDPMAVVDKITRCFYGF
jgi:hypothetical protein